MIHHYDIIQGCPVRENIGPYIYLVTKPANATVNSVYRGTDKIAVEILHANGKHTQAELYQMYLKGQGAPANRPGFSTHELKSDGVAYPGIPAGHDLEWWMQGFDVNDGDVDNVKYQAKARGWTLFQPYSSGSEYHHLNFEHEPTPTGRNGATKEHISFLRTWLPHK